MDGETAGSLVNTRLAYVAMSRAPEDARIYTNDAATIGQRLSTEITKTSAVDFRPPTERVYTPAEIERHHAPIREALEREDAAQFKWKGATGTVQTYQHTAIGRNVNIDGEGQFYSQDGKSTNQDAALDRAMLVGQLTRRTKWITVWGWAGRLASRCVQTGSVENCSFGYVERHLKQGNTIG